jgi:tripartite-type tricarboxylate transporter receptor subunit TctC
MKKIILTLILAVSSAIVNAKQVVPIVWPFAAGSSQANFLRELIEESNKQQDKYQFVFENKPGAGGAVAANHVLNNNSFTLLGTTSAFFIRPVFFPNESYNINSFTPVYVQCTDQPLVLISTKFKSFEDLKNNKRLTVGAINGTITDVIVQQLAKSLPGATVDLIPYQGTLQSVNDILGGQIDLAVGFVADVEQFVNLGRLSIVGMTGTIDHLGYKTFNSQKIPGFTKLASSYSIMANKNSNPETTEEIHKIFDKAASSTRLKTFYERDLCKPANLSFKETGVQFNNWQNYWKEKLKK